VSRSFLAGWRDAVADSNLGPSPKLVAFVLTTWMSGKGVCWPSKGLIAHRSSLSERTVYTATRELEGHGFLSINWSRGHSSHTYTATMPNQATTAGSTRQMVHADLANDDTNPATVAWESSESCERAAAASRHRDARNKKDVCPDCHLGGGHHATDCNHAPRQEAA
jgi:hypothetical protein